VAFVVFQPWKLLRSVCSDATMVPVQEEGVDLLLINGDVAPPVCRLMDFSKYKYELEKATREKQKASKG